MPPRIGLAHGSCACRVTRRVLRPTVSLALDRRPPCDGRRLCRGEADAAVDTFERKVSPKLEVLGDQLSLNWSPECRTDGKLGNTSVLKTRSIRTTHDNRTSARQRRSAPRDLTRTPILSPLYPYNWRNSPKSCTRNYCRFIMPKRLKFVDAFAGCGGLSLGLMQAGLVGQFAIEHDRFAFATLKANLLSSTSRFKYSWPRWLPKHPLSISSLYDGYRKQLAALNGEVDVLVGGPPCQGFSMAGRRKHDDPRNQLFRHYLRLVNILKPNVVVVENVRGFTMDFPNGDCVTNYSDALRAVLSDDYRVYERLLDLSKFGVPQARTRYFVISVRSSVSTTDPFELLESRIPSFLRTLGISAPVSSSNAISDLELGRCGTEPSEDTKGFNQIAYGRPLTRYQKLMNAAGATPTDLRLARHAEDIAQRFQQIINLCHAEGRLNTSISAEVRERFGLKKKALRVLDPDCPSPTITSMPDDLLHYSEPRTLTVRENARLQSFPDWYAFQGKYTTGGHLRKKEVPRFTQVANAVPPLVARAIGEMLVALMADSTRARPASAGHSSLQRVCKGTEVFAEA